MVEQSKRALVLTNHFAEFCGSEIVCLEIARWFARRGYEVTLAANHAAQPITAHADGIFVTRDAAALDLSSFDVAWCQHDMLSLLPFSCLERASRMGVPHVALASLSAHEPYEHVDWSMVRALSADVMANSPETKDEILRRAHGCMSREEIMVFHNAAPAAFWPENSRRPTAPDPQSITVISNHPPPELVTAMNHLRGRGRNVLHIGKNGSYRLVNPADITSADLVITIGKSVPYAIASNRPVYMYDHYGGDGWLTPGNFATSMHYNFSGRPRTRRLDAETLVGEIESGYGDAWAFCGRYAEATDLNLWKLDHHLTAFLDRSRQRQPMVRAETLARYLDQPQFRAHLETSYYKASVARRSYRMLVGGTYD